MLRIILLISLLNFAKFLQEPDRTVVTNLNTFKSICLNLDKVNLQFISTNDSLIAYYRAPFNKTFDKIVYQKTSDLNLNFDLSPTKVYLNENRNSKTKLIKKEENFKIVFDSRIRILTYSSKAEKLKKSNSVYHSIKNDGHCWFNESNFFQFNNWNCLYKNESVHNYINILNAFKGNQTSDPNDVKGIALVKLRNSNLTNWIIFDSKFTYLPQTDLLNRSTILYQSNSIYFGCAQQFCSKSSFDDIIYDISLNHLIIYRGQYFYKFNM